MPAATANALARCPCIVSSRMLIGGQRIPSARQIEPAACQLCHGWLCERTRVGRSIRMVGLCRGTGDDVRLGLLWRYRCARLRRRLDASLAERGPDLAPVAARLDVGRIISWHRPREPILRAV